MIQYSGNIGPVLSMIKVIIFDFNGVIADDETPHLVCFQEALAEAGLSLTKEDYYGTFLGMDERTCASLLLTVRDGQVDGDALSHITRRKAELFRLYTALHRPALFDGVVGAVKSVRERYRLAIASGGRREQIDAALADTPIEKDFELVVAAEDCPVGKPDPAIYRLTRARLSITGVGSIPLKADECLVIEDSLAGIRAAKAAGMSVIAIATTYPVDNLHEADYVLSSWEGVDLHDIVRRVGQIGQQGRLTAFQPE